MTVFGIDLTDPSTLGYPVVFGGVLLGSIVPVVPTGAVVGAAAAIAMTSEALSLPLIVVVSVLGALIGDLVTFAIATAGGAAAQRFVRRGQSGDRIAEVRGQFAKRGGLLVVVGRLVPAGRIPVLLAAGALEYPWRRLVPAAALGCVLWALAYAVLGVVSGGLFDSPLVATLVATALVFLVAGVGALVARRRGVRA